MYSKEEKLAAARKKLREFQGKQRESVLSKKNVPHNMNASLKDLTSQIPSQRPSSCTSESSHASSYHEHIPEKDESKIEDSFTDISIKINDSVNVADFQGNVLPMHSLDTFVNPTPNVSSEISDPGNFVNDGKNENIYGQLPHKVDESPKNHTNGIFSGEGITHPETHPFTASETSDSDKIKLEMGNMFKDIEAPVKETQNINSNDNSGLVQDSITNPTENEDKDIFWINFTSGKKSFETEHQNSEVPQLSASQLAEENNNLSEVLKRTQELLKYKTGEEQNLSQKVSFLQQKVNDLEGSLFNTENEMQNFRVKNEELLKKNDVINNMLEEIKQKYESKAEQYSELQQKLELKNKECEYLNIKLQETQNQLSSSLIKIQQLNIGESPDLNLRVIEVQNENTSLKSKIHELEKSLNNVNKEKEESNNSFQTYAQQCNAQLKSLTSEVKRLKKDNGLLILDCKSLEKKITELENEKRDSKAAVDQADPKSLSDEMDEITELKEENKTLKLHFQEKVKEIEELKNDSKEKLDEVNRLVAIVREMKSENLKLMEDRERTDRNEKLLAAMESDKVAAARAVSQNQKLKDQVVELEAGFIKLSHEKLQLTNELAHERHLRKEIELRLQELESSHCSDNGHHDHHDHHNHHDDHEHHEHHDHDQHDSSCTVTNESSDVNELKKIIRQLEEDKTELISRLKLKTSSKAIDRIADIKIETHYPENDPHKTDDPETLKVLLQQMEEKLKRTMNEIAVLDEEKEKLEHIVLQLQCETETIGEYISLYQNQRMLLRKRSKEKDDQLMQLSKDKEELKSKLVKLHDLVNHLLAKKATKLRETRDISKIAFDEDKKEHAEATASKIQNLISDIQSTNLIDNPVVSFEHCPCCSGRLITI